MRVCYTPRAFADREQIFDYLFQRSPTGALNVLASIIDAVELLSSQPYSGFATESADIRVKFVVRYPYKSSTEFATIPSNCFTFVTRLAGPGAASRFR